MDEKSIGGIKRIHAGILNFSLFLNPIKIKNREEDLFKHII